MSEDLDLEIESIAAIWEFLDRLQPDSAARVLQYVSQRNADRMKPLRLQNWGAQYDIYAKASL